MAQDYLFIALGISTFGFFIWFNISSSLNLPKRYQILYDDNPPYVRRVYRRRLLGGIIFGVIPWLISNQTKWIEHSSISQYHFTFNMSKNALYLTLGSLILIFIIQFFVVTRNRNFLDTWPDIRVRFWRPPIFIWSAFWWLIYLFSIEYFYRGFLLEALRINLDNDIWAALIAGGLYALGYFWRYRFFHFLLTFIYGVLACLLVVQTGSILPVIIINVCNTLLNEWLSVKHHRETFVFRT